MSTKPVAPAPLRTRSMIPRGVLLIYAALIGASLVGVFGNRLLTGPGGTAPAPAIVETRALRFIDLTDGSLEVRSVADGNKVGSIAAGEDGFVRSTLAGPHARAQAIRRRYDRAVGIGAPGRRQPHPHRPRHPRLD